MCYDNGYPGISREFQFRWLNMRGWNQSENKQTRVIINQKEYRFSVNKSYNIFGTKFLLRNLQYIQSSPCINYFRINEHRFFIFRRTAAG